MTEVNWLCCSFSELENHQLYAMMKLRVDVFIVEQACIYPELDGKDLQADTVHLLGFQHKKLIVYARMMAPQQSHRVAIIGRVVTIRAMRGKGIARQLMEKLLFEADALWPGVPVGLSAQTQVVGFYASMGFSVTSEEYFEDGISHVDMIKKL